jgi:hypothetical protein
VIHRTIRPGSLVPILSLVALGGCGRPGPVVPLPRAARIDTLVLRQHTSFLAHDLLQGRGTGDPGAAIAAQYLAAQCRGLGLSPLGDDFALPVPLEAAVVRRNETLLRIAQGADSTTFRPGEGFIVSGGLPGALAPFRGTPVYVGTAEEIRAAGDRLPDVRGRVAVTGGVLRADLASLLARRGATGLLSLTPDLETYGLYRASRGNTLLVLADSAVESSFHPTIPVLILAPPVSPVLARAVQGGGTVDVGLAFDRRPIEAWNVGCRVPGQDPRLADTLIVLTAHYDHLGVSTPDEQGDSIYNGFSDDAAGVAMLLSIAQAVRNQPSGGLRHGLALLFFTGEERGLLGSDYFVARPPVPLGRIRAVVNLDAGAPPARPWNWRIAGGEGTPLGALAVDVAASRGWAATRSAATANSDYFPFARKGIPAVFLIPGTGPYEGLTADSSDALRRRWDRYHQASDHYDDAFPFAGLRRYAEYALMLVEAIDRRF